MLLMLLARPHPRTVASGGPPLQTRTLRRRPPRQRRRQLRGNQRRKRLQQLQSPQQWGRGAMGQDPGPSLPIFGFGSRLPWQRQRRPYLEHPAKQHEQVRVGTAEWR